MASLVACAENYCLERLYRKFSLLHFFPFFFFFTWRTIARRAPQADKTRGRRKILPPWAVGTFPLVGFLDCDRPHPIIWVFLFFLFFFFSIFFFCPAHCILFLYFSNGPADHTVAQPWGLSPEIVASHFPGALLTSVQTPGVPQRVPLRPELRLLQRAQLDLSASWDPGGRNRALPPQQPNQ